MIRILSVLAFIWLMADPVGAQSLTKRADRQFEQLSYAQAIELYEQALADSGALSVDDRRDARARLGYSYQQTRDMVNAERIYRDLLRSGKLPASYARCQLFYAQALASNGKYQEAQLAYDAYGNLQTTNKRLPAFSKLYRDVSTLTRNSNSYRVEFLTMNTRRAEFSPTFYKDGLVFVSTGNGGNGVKRVFKWNNSPFLDLYYLPDLKTISADKAASLGGSAPAKQARIPSLRPLGGDDFTAPTSNDTRTVGLYGGPTTGRDAGSQSSSESDQFSRMLNTKYHEGPAAFSKDGTTVIFTRNNFNRGRYRKSKDGVNKLKLYTSTQTNGLWSNAEELPFNSDEFSTGHPSLASDPSGHPDQLLYFASDRPGGFGGTDIYVSKRVNNTWSEPVNLGKDLNTKGNELFPFADDKGSLYFSSDGHPGLGALDLFHASLTPNGQQGRVVRNLGEPLNSAKDDFGIVTDGARNSGYFSSNRKNGGADDDVYRFTREGSLYPCRELTLSVIDANSKEPLGNTSIATASQKEIKTDTSGLARICIDVDSDVTFTASRHGYVSNKVGFSTKDLADDQPSLLQIMLNPADDDDDDEKPGSAITTLRGRITNQAGDPVARAKVVLVSECDDTRQKTTTGPDGTYTFAIRPGCGYSLEALKSQMGTTGSRIGKDGTGPTDLTMFQKNDVIKIDSIYYDTNKATIRPDAAIELDKVVALMSKYPAMTIELRAHTDSRATAPYNKTLSENRAKSAVAYLKEKGIAARRLTAKGYGESALLNECSDGVTCSEEEHQKNRRTEIKILKIE